MELGNSGFGFCLGILSLVNFLWNFGVWDLYLGFWVWDLEFGYRDFEFFEVEYSGLVFWMWYLVFSVWG